MNLEKADITKAPKVAVVILNWNGESLLETFLPSVTVADYDNYEVWIADNASSDNSKAIASKFPSVKWLQLDKNYGFTGGYNRALAQIKADYFVLLNSDVEVTPNWIEPIITLMENDKTIGACQPKILAYKQKTHFEYAGASGGYLDAYGFPFCRGRIFDICEEDKGQYNTNESVFWASGAAMFVRANLYNNMGGLDEAYFAHMEEIDFCWRIKRAGYKVMVCPKSVVFHLGGATLNKTNPKKTYLNFRNNLVLLFKNTSVKYLVFRFPIRILLDTIAAYKSLFSGDFAGFWAILKAHLYFIFNIFSSIKRRIKATKQVKNNRIGEENKDGWIKKSVVYRHFLKKKQTFIDINE